MSGRPLLTIPKRPVRQGDATFAEKAEGGRPDRTSPPLIRSFEGTSFIDDWLRIGPRNEAPERDSLPELVPFRDWTEPPGALIDASGTPKWAAGQVIRGEPANPVGTFGIDGATVATDGVPQTGDLPWLRKLYLPAHDRFNIIASELVCLQPTLPSVSRSRIQETGVVIRRLAFDDDGNRTELDWVAKNEERGLWLDLAPFGGLAEPGAPPESRLDPSNPPAQATLRTLLSESSDKTMVVRTGSGSVLANEPGKPNRTVAWATLPLTSAEQQVFVDRVPTTLEGFADDLIADLAADFEGTAADLHHTIARAFIDLVDPWIPARPSSTALAAARADLIEYCSTRTETSEDVIQERISDFYTWLWEQPEFSVDNPNVWVNTALFAADSPVSRALPLPAVTVSPTEFRALIQEELNDRWEELKTGLEERVMLTVEAQRTLTTWSAIVAGRVRASRLRIVELVYAQLEAEFGDAIDTADADEQVSASTLALEIDNWISAEEERSRTPRPWSAISFLTGSTQKMVVHRAARVMERELAVVRERLSPAGPAYLAALFDLRPGVSEVDLDSFDLDAVHLDWNGELEAGLLVFPTAHLTDAELDAFVGSSGEIWDQARSSAITDLELLTNRAQTQLLPRFDTDHLYVARLFARVAGPHPCDPVEIVWSRPTEPFVIAAHGDLLGIRPVAFEAPNLPKLLADIPKMARAGANPFAHVLTPENSGYDVGEEMGDTKRSWELAMICSFGIPIFTICAMIIFKIIFAILITIPGFVWMLLLKFCIPIPRRTSS